MSVTNVVNARFTYGTSTKTRGIYQWDYGQVLKFEGLSLPSAYTVHFANQLLAGNAKTQVGGADGVSIPDEYLTTGLPVYAWVYLHTGESDGETVYSVMIPVTARPRPVEDAPTPVQQGAIDTAIAALNAGVATVEGIAEAIPQTVDTALQSAKDSGEFDGPPGRDGTDGLDGRDGTNGVDGYSPTAIVTQTSGGATISITDKNGTTTASISNGTNGQNGSPGQNGQDGYSPTASVSKSGGTATITITDKNGTTTATVSDGQNGTNGQDGAPGADGASAYVWIRYAAAQPTQDSDIKTTPDAWMGIYAGGSATAPTAYTSYTWYNIKGATGPVQDVQVNGSSVLSNGIANVPKADANTFGVVKPKPDGGTTISSNDGTLILSPASNANIKAGETIYKPIAPSRQHLSTFYGLAKAAGDSTQSSSSNAVGTYTDAAQVAIQKMLGIYEAPWELIKSHTGTNATEADVEITADGNGQSFELTDVFLVLWTTSDTGSAKADYGRVRLYYGDGSNEYDDVFTGSALSAGQTGIIEVKQEKNAVFKSSVTRVSTGSNSTLQMRADYRGGAYAMAEPIAIVTGVRAYTSINITKVTGGYGYNLYGKRKWTT